VTKFEPRYFVFCPGIFFLRLRLSILQTCFGLTAPRKTIYNFCVTVRTLDRVQQWALVNQFGIVESHSQNIIQFLVLWALLYSIVGSTRSGPVTVITGGANPAVLEEICGSTLLMNTRSEHIKADKSYRAGTQLQRMCPDSFTYVLEYFSLFHCFSGS
jgi:hypothetical protein